MSYKKPSITRHPQYESTVGDIILPRANRGGYSDFNTSPESSKAILTTLNPENYMVGTHQLLSKNNLSPR